jgi:hypothetical protein
MSQWNASGVYIHESKEKQINKMFLKTLKL